MSYQYYNENAQEFYDRTIDADVSKLYQAFLRNFPEQGRILDLGCGSGRDAKFFSEKGYHVVAVDASIEMVKKTQEVAPLVKAKQLFFEDLDLIEEFEGVWANASLLHVPYESLPQIFDKIARSLKNQGVFFCSFKYGTGYRSTPGRDFYDMDEDRFQKLLPSSFSIIEMAQEDDSRSQRSPSPDQKWLQVLCHKK